MSAPRDPRVIGAPLDHPARDHALRAALDRDRSALVFALDAAAVRVPLPPDDVLAGHEELPSNDATVVDFVVAEDRMLVVEAWERAKAVGLGQDRVRLASRPDGVFSVTLIDCRHRFGSWIGVLAAESDGDARGRRGSPDDPALLVPSRPRTATLHKNLGAVITDVDDRGTAMLGWSRAEMVGRRSLEFIHPDDQARAIGQWLEMRAQRATQRVRVRHRHRDGHWVWVEVENTFVGLDAPDVLVAIAQLTDISDEMAAHEAVRARERLFDRLNESLPVGVFQVDAVGRIVYANPRLSHLVGRPATTDVGAPVDGIIGAVAPTDRDRLRDALAAATRGGIDSTLEVDLDPDRRVDGPAGERHCRVQITIAALAEGQDPAGAIVSVTDITEGARLREELRIKATYDPLTGCLARAAVIAELETMLAESGGPGLAVIFVDLVRFKAVNDSYGHPVGDRLLALAGRRLLDQARGTDRVGRLGGDEFLVLCPDVGDPPAALTLARRLHEHLHGDIDLAGHPMPLAASVGVTLATPRCPADLVLARSDQAMYEAKRRGDGPVFRPVTVARPAADLRSR